MDNNHKWSQSEIENMLFVSNNKSCKNKRWEDSEKDLLKQMYSNSSAKIIAEKMNRTQSSIKSMAIELKLSKNTKQTDWSDNELNILKELYPKNISQEEILLKLNNKTWEQARNKAIHKFYLKRPIYRPYNVISNYFSDIKTIEQAYILGFIAADGCIRNDGSGLVIGIHNKDKELLNWIISEICPDYQIKYNESKATNKQMEIFAISDKQINLDLQKYNMAHRKTFNLQWPDLQI